MSLRGGIKMAIEGTRATPRPEDAAAAGSGAAAPAGDKASEEQEDRGSMAGERVAKEAAEAKTAQFATVRDAGTFTGQRGLDFILDIPLKVSVELGRTRMLVNDLLQLGQGSVIELSKLAGEPLEVLVNQKLVARGEVVVVNEKFGVRLTDIISPLERVEQLK
jgi:flagellar motor switch protein FliN/FliY